MVVAWDLICLQTVLTTMILVSIGPKMVSVISTPNTCWRIAPELAASVDVWTRWRVVRHGGLGVNVTSIRPTWHTIVLSPAITAHHDVFNSGNFCKTHDSSSSTTTVATIASGVLAIVLCNTTNIKQFDTKSLSFIFLPIQCSFMDVVKMSSRNKFSVGRCEKELGYG